LTEKEPVDRLLGKLKKKLSKIKMLEKIKEEKRSAEHLLYVSLKYTKTCDVILNLIARWQVMIEDCMEELLRKIKREKVITAIPLAPKTRVDVLLDSFKKEKVVKDVLELYLFFRRIPKDEKIREGEFRKNLALKVFDRGAYVTINVEKLEEWHELLESFISFVEHHIVGKI